MSARVFHSGERDVQQRAGVLREAEAVGRIVPDALTAPLGRFLATQRMAVAATLDDRGRPWASLLTGPPGFLTAVDDRLLRASATPAKADPLAENLRARPEIGLLVIDPRTRQRIRVNGRGLLTPEGVWLETQEVYGNCPKYIQKRRLAGEDERGATTSRRSSTLEGRQQDWIAQADTFFIASFHPQGGADASHRGGRPGFVRVLGERRLSFADHPGNNMFNTLGNLMEYPQAGLLFLDFATGGVLQMTGRTELLMEPERRVVFEAQDIVERTGATPLRWELVEPSPANP